jgi:hypothetical protein
VRTRKPEDKVWGKPCAVIPRRLAEGGAAPVRSPDFKPKLVSSLVEMAETSLAQRQPEAGSGGCHGRF